MLGLVDSALLGGGEVLVYRLQGMVTPEVLVTSKDVSSSNIHIVSLHSLPALLLAMNGLSDLLSSLPEVVLIIFDGLGAYFDQNIQDSWRSYHMKHLSQMISKICITQNIACAYTSHVSTKMIGDDGSIASYDTGLKAVMMPQFGTLVSERGSRIVMKRLSFTSVLARLLPTTTSANEGTRAMICQLRWEGGITHLS